jgi:hypothetical protein
MSKATKAFLDQYFYDCMEGIDELVQQDILSKWFPDRVGQKEDRSTNPSQV